MEEATWKRNQKHAATEERPKKEGQKERGREAARKRVRGLDIVEKATGRHNKPHDERKMGIKKDRERKREKRMETWTWSGSL